VGATDKGAPVEAQTPMAKPAIAVATTVAGAAASMEAPAEAAPLILAAETAGITVTVVSRTTEVAVATISSPASP